MINENQFLHLIYYYILNKNQMAFHILGVANTVHGMGAVAGILFGLILAKKQNQRSRLGLRFPEPVRQQLFVLGALVVGGVIVDYLTYGP